MATNIYISMRIVEILHIQNAMNLKIFLWRERDHNNKIPNNISGIYKSSEIHLIFSL